MHPRNKMRLLAGLTIDPTLETRELSEARNVPMKRNELKKKTEETVRAHVNGVTKAISHLENAIKALEKIPAHDFMGDIPHYISEIEEILSADGGDAGMKQLLSVYQDEHHRLKGGGEVRESFDQLSSMRERYKKLSDRVDGLEGKEKRNVEVMMNKLGDEIAKEANRQEGKKKDVKEGTWVRDERGTAYDRPSENEEELEKFKTADDFSKGDKVLYDNGIWIVHVTDAQADMVGVVPASMSSASKEEKDRSMQQVKRDKIRKPSKEETKVMAGPDGILGTADDVKLEGMKEVITNAMTPKKGEKATGSIAKMAKSADEKKEKKKEGRMTESTYNYTPSNSLTFDTTKSDPANVVGQDDRSWSASVDPDYDKDEYPSQLDQRGDQSMDDYTNKVKVPTKVKSALKDAISTFVNEAEKMSNGHTFSETKQFYLETAEAFQKLLDYLNEGTIQSIKQAQTFASSLMGPMSHKLPDAVWDFITHGGQKRSLKDYMSPVDRKYPITGPRNTQD